MSDCFTHCHVDTFCQGHVNTDSNVIITPNTYKSHQMFQYKNSMDPVIYKVCKHQSQNSCFIYTKHSAMFYLY